MDIIINIYVDGNITEIGDVINKRNEKKIEAVIKKIKAAIRDLKRTPTQ